ncbi:DUF2325 domain-containing protein [Methylobacterium sp. E-045]|uniref:DUF2325 domain-containing protein n=1 Tax=Methylobacterium sp. E-045 TaxID=2836575 RepID=UPI001FB867C1|nr:DUF2325 domain-containing protein [Methylobacterium sp. E-045]MCJ2131159.1 DUF2325 domain-containing protein [Methylobacterium sp. E-045]
MTTAEGRGLLVKLGVPNARTLSEHHLHGQIVQLAGRRDGGGKLLQKALDRRHELEIRQFDKARTTDAVRALWKEYLARGEIPGAYWAAITHPATDWALVQEIFGEVHMLSHLVGQSNRADIRRLRQLEADLAARDEIAAAQELRIREVMEQRDALQAQNRAIEAARALTAAALGAVEPDTDRDNRKSLETRLAREQAHAEALDEKLAILLQASTRMSRELEAETARRQIAEAELAAVEAMLADGRDGEVGDASLAADPVSLEGRTLLYVGGRPRQITNLRRFARDRGGRLLNHDGGIEDSLSLLPGLVGQSDLVLFPVECVSHEAVNMVKRCCETTGRTFRPVRTASLASFVHAVLPMKSSVSVGQNV